MSKKPSKKPSRAARAATSAPRRNKVATARVGAAKRPPPVTSDDTADRIARALETIAAHLASAGPATSSPQDIAKADAFIWNPSGRLIAVPKVNRVELTLLKGIDRMRDILIENTERFATGLPANNALLWGARGMG